MLYHFFHYFLWYITQIYCLISSSHIQNCNNGNGVSIYKLQVHCDTAALIKLRTDLSKEFSTDFNTMSAVMKYFGGIFDLINEELEPYGVQVRADLSKLTIEKFRIPYDQRKCEGEDSIGTRTVLAMNTLPAGNHVLLFYCKKLKDGLSFGKHGRECNNAIGFAIGNLRNLALTMQREIIRGISRNSYRNDGILDTGFNSSLCTETRKCIKGEPYGEFVSDLRNVRHLAAETYITGKGYKIREHDLYDDAEPNHGDDPLVFATQDYSNDDELYEDFVPKEKGLFGKLNNLKQKFTNKISIPKQKKANPRKSQNMMPKKPKLDKLGKLGKLGGFGLF
ncbi:hypothetical protein BDAP_002662 [Binucleata daphniae]